MNFLSAKWQHLLLVNYRIPPEILTPFVPRGTAIDMYDGQAFVSLVAFMFNQTRILGLPIPFHVNFEEVNLRFYVTPSDNPTRRGVTFIKEIVPRAAIPLIANNLFNENYIVLPMAHINDESEHQYSFGVGMKNIISGKVSGELVYPAAGSMEEFITEHYWGYSKGKNRTLEYRVDHPQWTCCRVKDFIADVDYANIYGREFGFLAQQKPCNVLYAAGSNVSVSFPRAF